LALLRCSVLGRVVDGPDVAHLEQRLATFFSVPSVVACNSGRVALELALRATGVRAGDEVIVPTFCCASTIPPIVAVGAVPVLADVGADLMLTPETVEAARTPRTRGVIVAHLFGNPARIEALEEVCRRCGLVLIDDAAQAFGARLNRRPLGTFGDVGIASFGNGKVCFGVGGGVLVSRDAAVVSRARGVALARAQVIPTLKRAAGVMVWRRWRRWSLPLQVTLNRRLGSSPEPEYTRGAMANLNAAVALSLVDTLEANLAARRARVEAYHQRLGREAEISLLPHHHGSACLTQLVGFAGGEHVAFKVLRTLRDAGYEVDRSFRPLHLQLTYERYARKPLPHTEREWQALVELPCEPSVRMVDIERIAALIRTTVGTS
jgi:dTDP-4-amino-4,6-dideoxygalactose transaminase